MAPQPRDPWLERLAEEGRPWGSLCYGATIPEIYTSGAEQVAKVLGGTRPSELPVREATRFELVINNWTAKTIGLTIPPSLLARADEVIE
jgi:putative ABC transport system substrate-binding protein